MLADKLAVQINLCVVSGGGKTYERPPALAAAQVEDPAVAADHLIGAFVKIMKWGHGAGVGEPDPFAGALALGKEL